MCSQSFGPHSKPPDRCWTELHCENIELKLLVYMDQLYESFFILLTLTTADRHTLTAALIWALWLPDWAQFCVTMQHIHINDGKQTNMNLSGPTQIERKKGNLSCVHGTETSLTENPWETKEQKRLSHTFTLRLYHCQTAMAGSLNTTLQKVYVSLHTVIMTQNVMLVLKVTSANNKTLN